MFIILLLLIFLLSPILLVANKLMNKRGNIESKKAEKQIEQVRGNFVRPYDEENRTPLERVFEEYE